MDLNEFSQARFINAEMIDEPKVVTIRSVRMEQVAGESQPIMYFHELAVGLVLKRVNRESLATVLGTTDTDSMIGRQIELFRDDHVKFGRKIVAGVRIRAAR